MKKYIYLLLIIASYVPDAALAQDKKPVFTGAKATLKQYKVLYVLNSGEEKKMTGILRNIGNAMNDPRLKGKLEVELVVFGDGVALFQKNGPFEAKLQELRNAGIFLAQCENTLRERKIEKSSLFDFISFVPSGNGEMIIRQYEGWAIVHP